VDNSGSMQTSTVLNSFNLFEDRIQENGFTIVRGVYNDDEDWVDPCVTTTLLG
jgi:hypothetical protein